MILEILDIKNPHYVASEHVWRECGALYRGGEHFQSMLGYFLPMNPQEPPDVYSARKREASYLSYVGPIVDYYVAWLFSQSLNVKAKKANATAEVIDVAPIYSEFQADCGGDVSLADFIKKQTACALVERCAHWIIELPRIDDAQYAAIKDQSMPKDVFNDLGLGQQARLLPLERMHLWDWQIDDSGKLLWAITHQEEQRRDDPTKPRDLITETWKIYDREKVRVFQLEYSEKKGRPDPLKTDVPQVDQYYHRFLEVPIITLDVGEGLWIGERTRKPQIEHFRLNTAKSWLIRRTCYAMPVIQFENPESEVDMMGAGYYLKLGANDKFSWTAPPATPFDVIQKSIDAQRDEIYRVVHQMAQGLDNNAETVGRSADSKQIDTAATRILLNAYGAVVKKAVEETYEMLSDALGDTDVYWSVEGFDGYDTATAGEVIANVTEATLLNIPSKAFQKEAKCKVAFALLPGIDPNQKEVIRKEIHDFIDSVANVEDLALPAEVQIKKDVQAAKDETALKIQEIKSEDVRMEVAMARHTSGNPDAALKDATAASTIRGDTR